MKNEKYLEDKYLDEFEVIDGLNQHPSGMNFDEWKRFNGYISERQETIDGKFKVGDGATFGLWTDRMAGTVIEISRDGTRLKWQEDKAVLKTEMKFQPGGFAGHCLNNDGQQYDYEPDPEGMIEEFSLRKNGQWKAVGVRLTVTGYHLFPGRKKKYDYNF